ncbi:helix-turn-helix transcriptional regulator [Yoonia sp. R2-816]|uniref:helix-turn-helix transcriptional regulator n=1 Tax=Yoonia sp. R2-816 TaxID=3342638 RepID=UPI0037288916
MRSNHDTPQYISRNRIGPPIANPFPVGPIPVSKSTWWQGVKEGRFPQPQKLGPRTTVWKVEDIRALFDGQTDG